MAIAHSLRAAALPFQLVAILVAMLATTSVSAQAEPTPPPTEAAAPASSQEVPLVQLDAPAERVTAPPPVTRPEPAAAPGLPPPESAPPPACDLSATPSPCTQPQDAYRHDGFYLRMINETQYLAFLGEGPDGDASIKGLGTDGTFAIGGSPLPGLVIAGTMGSTMLRGNFNGRPEGREASASAARVMIGVLADWYPRPDDGWHVGAALGFGAITLTDSAIKDAVAPTFAAKIFGGYDWWIGPQWSIGLMALFAVTPTAALIDSDGDKNGYRFSTLSAGIAWSLTLH